MHTKAVYRTAQALNDAGLVALRFNFRGVGASTGSFDDGLGEREDVVAALDWLEARHPKLPLIVAGFSFGSLVGLAVGAADARVVGLVGVGLPIQRSERHDYRYLATSDKPVLVVQGEDDEFGSGELVERVLSELGAQTSIVRVPDADHYFTGRLEELRAAVRGYFEAGPGSQLLATV
jgi:alpha/beta superfamily hydrolase